MAVLNTHATHQRNQHGPWLGIMTTTHMPVPAMLPSSKCIAETHSMLFQNTVEATEDVKGVKSIGVKTENMGVLSCIQLELDLMASNSAALYAADHNTDNGVANHNAGATIIDYNIPNNALMIDAKIDALVDLLFGGN